MGIDEVDVSDRSFERYLQRTAPSEVEHGMQTGKPVEAGAHNFKTTDDGQTKSPQALLVSRCIDIILIQFLSDDVCLVLGGGQTRLAVDLL
jgi:hypothetical protein